MKAAIIIFILVAALTVSFLGQPKTAKPINCKIEQLANFKRLTDTVTLSVSYLTIGEIGSTKNLEQLQKTGILKVRDFEYSLHFSSIGCENKYYLPCSDKKVADRLYYLTPGSKIKITCVFFKKYPMEGTDPYFIITKVQI